MGPNAVMQFLQSLAQRLVALRKSQQDLQHQQNQVRYGQGLVASLHHNEAAMKHYALEIDLARIRRLTSEDRRAIAHRLSTQSKSTLPTLTPRQPRIERAMSMT